MRRERKRYSWLILIVSIVMFACKKETKTSPQSNTTTIYHTKDTGVATVIIDTTVTGSGNSKFKNSYLSLAKYRNVFRRNSGIDSIRESIWLRANFYKDSLDDNYENYHNMDTVGGVYINNFALSGPYVYYPPPAEYFYYIDHPNEYYSNFFNSALWRVVSRNNSTDIIYDAGVSPYYLDTLAHVIDRSTGFMIKIDPTNAPNADSIRISINFSIDTIVSASAGNVNFSPARLSTLTATSNWDCVVLIHIYKTNFASIDGRGYKIATDRETQFTVNVN